MDASHRLAALAHEVTAARAALARVNWMTIVPVAADLVRWPNAEDRLGAKKRGRKALEASSIAAISGYG